MVYPLSERRKGPDLWLRLLTATGLISGLSLVVALLVTAIAKPEVETFFDRYYNVQMRKSWDMELIELIFYLLLFCLFTSLLGLGINAWRWRRKGDYIRASLIFTLGVALFGLAGCLLLMSRYS